MRIEFTVAGEPQPRPRSLSRAVKGKTGKWVSQVYQPRPKHPKNAKQRKWLLAHQWQDAIVRAAMPLTPAEPLDCPLALTIDAYFPRTQELLKPKYADGPIPHDVRPDRDNLEKAVSDALSAKKQPGVWGRSWPGFWKDDSRVCAGQVRKWYVARGAAPGIRVVIEPVPMPPMNPPLPKPPRGKKPRAVQMELIP